MQIDLKNCTIRIQDGKTPTPNHIDVKLGEGNCRYDEKRNIQYTLDRGKLDEVREGDQVPVDVSLDFVWEYISGDGDIPSIEDALKQIGAAATWVSSDSDTCRPYAVDIQIIHAPVPSTCGDKETTLLADFRWEGINHDPKAGTCSLTGKCNITTATSTRTSQS